MEFLSQLTLLQWLGTIFGVVQVLLARQNNIHNYLFGVVAILISIWVLYQSRLYADILLNLYYLVMSVYGWFYWKMGKQKQETPISASNRREHTIAGGIVLGCFGLMAYWLAQHTDSDVPYWDALVCAFAWAGMWLMAKRKIENWIYLNISNFISIPLLIYKELYIYAGLTAFLFAVAISGYIKWKKIIAHERDGTYAGA
ncbi:nicotinamide riboside transporter PnuC [Flagellimonas halotolerans]|uniref:Nicotinamide riboside transporter PnuC n=1 Tax=Flagellimonas halotolerans TaxID=3112164 RepID=A0ABU6IS61_9FLAO|nr:MULTISPECIES: nicotinamide riboside transporter PnuC [unclassified Allomuricauda]MEC3966098.1 nicotinamide riboside transporter PnuC [Muricauda sp. SYSU M86414]MEC4265963.1 nicotinamide riboside transporter PnuC [Muricauda sp. SYSU M84420]